jgi:SAM-dependent methyltransferase
MPPNREDGLQAGRSPLLPGSQMHDTAYELGSLFYETYVQPGSCILDIGSMNVNGTLRDARPGGSYYVGVDLEAGNGVDVVVAPDSRLPFKAESFDAVTSSSCFEHDSMFWSTFLEMCRVLKSGGYLYLNAPSRGGYHRYPIDAWRFYPDAGIALRDWARNNYHDIELLESFITENRGDIWNDCVMIFSKNGSPPGVGVADRHPLAINVRQWPDLETISRRHDRW